MTKVSLHLSDVKSLVSPKICVINKINDPRHTIVTFTKMWYIYYLDAKDLYLDAKDLYLDAKYLYLDAKDLYLDAKDLYLFLEILYKTGASQTLPNQPRR